MGAKKKYSRKKKNGSTVGAFLKITITLTAVVVAGVIAWRLFGGKIENAVGKRGEKPPDAAVEAVAPVVENALEKAGLGPGHIVEGNKELKQADDAKWYLRKRSYKVSDDELMRVTLALSDIEQAGKIKVESKNTGDAEHLVVIEVNGFEAWRILLTAGKRAQNAPPKPKPIPPNDPVIAVIIDDVGDAEYEYTKKLIELDAPITFSALPNSPRAAQMREMLKRAGKEIMLHVPMEPNKYERFSPTPDMLWVSMDVSQIRAITARFIASTPEAVGANNHMGSRFTRWDAGMKVFLEEIGRRKMFFVDSMTDPRSEVCDMAVLLNVKCYSRDVFLDTVNDERAVAKQWRRLLSIARKQGAALAIGHPRSATYETLRVEIPKLNGTEFRLVTVSELIKATTVKP